MSIFDIPNIPYMQALQLFRSLSFTVFIFILFSLSATLACAQTELALKLGKVYNDESWVLKPGDKVFVKFDITAEGTLATGDLHTTNDRYYRKYKILSFIPGADPAVLLKGGGAKKLVPLKDIISIEKRPEKSTRGLHFLGVSYIILGGAAMATTFLVGPAAVAIGAPIFVVGILAVCAKDKLYALQRDAYFQLIVLKDT